MIFWIFVLVIIVLAALLALKLRKKKSRAEQRLSKLPKKVVLASEKKRRQKIKFKAKKNKEELVKAGIPAKTAEDVQKTIDDELDKILESIPVSINSCPADKLPPCKKGFIVKKNDEGQACCYIDPKSQVDSKMDVAKELATTLAKEVLITEIGPIVAKSMAKLSARLGAKLMTKVATKFAGVMTKSMVKVASKMAVKLAAFGAKSAAKAAMGPAGWAMMAFDVLSLVLDLWDPMGYNDFSGAKVNGQMRDQIEVGWEDDARANGSKYPYLASMEYNTPEFEDYFQENKMDVISDKIQNELMEDPVILKILEKGIPDEAAFEKKMEAILDKKLGAYLDSDEFSEYYCNSYAEKYGKDKVKYIKGFGCSLTEKECTKFNKFYDTAPEENRQFALWTDTYRIRNKADPGDNKSPNMVEKKLSEKACLLSGLRTDRDMCYGKGDWDQDKGMCSYSSTYCSKKGLKKKRNKSYGVNDCVTLPGQDIAEMIFGTTVTRFGIKFANEYHKFNMKVGKTLLKYGLDPLATLDLLEDAGKLALKHGKDVALKGLRLGKEGIDKLGEISELGTEAVAEAAEKGIEAIRDAANILKEFGPEDAKKAIKQGADAARKAAEQAIDAVEDAANQAAKESVRAVNKAANATKDAANNAARAATNAANETARFTQKAAKDAERRATQVANQAANRAKKYANATKDFANKAKRDTERALNNVGRGITDAANVVGDGVVDAANVVGGGVKDAANEVGNFFCFSGETPIKLYNGNMELLKNIKLGDVLANEGTVNATMQIKSNKDDPFYRIYSCELDSYILVTGSHYIKSGDTFIPVREFHKAEKLDTVDDVLYCLVTSNHTIPVGEFLFWDWEDNLLVKV